MTKSKQLNAMDSNQLDPRQIMYTAEFRQSYEEWLNKLNRMEDDERSDISGNNNQ